ncbi:MAG: hypothetical protein E7538_10315 [Ruminococcaceae bacterium]|nr:hypothetical protein [Oscillospiraceae bacterium]
MEKREVFVPLMSWLIGGSRIGGSYNTYTGSIGTDPLKGAFGQRIFNYRICIEKNEEDTEYIHTAVYYGMSCYESQNEDEIKKNLFELTEEGMQQLEAYLNKEADSFFARE